MSGALLYFGQKDGHKALMQSAAFLQQQLQSEQVPNTPQINIMFDVLASADMMIDNLQNKQPVLQSMFDVALRGSEQLKLVA